MPWVCVRDVQTPVGAVRRGRVVDDDDPALVGCEDAFQRVDDGAPVEQATANPGEKRTTRRKA